MSFKLSGYSTALFSTWYFIEELGVLFDCGDGCAAGLLQKSGKVKYIFMSHADRDHLTGLLQFCQLNNRECFPKLFYPADCGSFPALHAFSTRFDPHVEQGAWAGIKDQQQIEIGKDLYVTPIRNNHVPASANLHKSFGYLVERTKRKLKEEYAGLPGKEIAALRKTLGEDAVTYEVRDKLLAYSGDTPVENEKIWDNTDILIHEATFLDPGSIDMEDPRSNKHSLLEDVIAMVSRIKINHLVLGHFSPRYDDEEILAAVNKFCKQYSLNCKVYVVLPGRTVKHILADPVC
jgi:ribonuclease Z